VFVVMTCTSETIGTDLIGECERIDLPGLRVIPVSPDKRSLNSKFGARDGAMEAVASLMDRTLPVEKDTVCMGMMGRIYDMPEDMEDVEAILKAYGLRVKHYFPTWQTVSEIEDVPSCEYYIIPARGFHAKQLRSIFAGDMKVLGAESIMGIRGVRDWCSMLGKATGRSGNGFLEKAEREYESLLAPYREKLAGKRVVLYNRSYMTPDSLIDTLQDLGMEVAAFISWPEHFEDRNERVDRHPEVPRITDVELCHLAGKVGELGADVVISGDPRTGSVGLPWTGFHAEHVGYRQAGAFAHRVYNAMHVKPKQAWRK